MAMVMVLVFVIALDINLPSFSLMVLLLCRVVWEGCHVLGCSSNVGALSCFSSKKINRFVSMERGRS